MYIVVLDMIIGVIIDVVFVFDWALCRNIYVMC